MDQAQDTLLGRLPWVPRRTLSVAEHRRIGEVGILAEEDRVELIEGEIVRMGAIGSRHMSAVMLLTRLLIRAVGDRAMISVQSPVQLGSGSEPEPDVALLRPRADAYAKAIPRANEVLLAVEVADTSSPYDRTVKATLHARHGIPETWIVDVTAAGTVEVCREPAREGYGSVSAVGRDAIPSIVAL